MKEKRSRSLLKGISYRALAIVASVLFVYFLTNSYQIAIALGIFEVVFKIFLYYIHERAWNIVKWGKSK